MAAAVSPVSSRPNRIFLAALFLLAAGTLAWSLTRPAVSFDDAYITYRYARNLAHGLGFVYNPGERVLGTTTPLYTLLLAAGSLAGAELPALSLLLGGLGWAGAVISLGLLAWDPGDQPAGLASGLLAAGLLALEPSLTQVLGMETPVYMAFCLGALAAHRHRRGRWAAALAGLAFLTRWDGVLVAAVIGLAELIRRRRLPWDMAAVLAAIVVPWLLFSQLYFGSIFPNTFFAKAGQLQTALVGGGAQAFAEVARQMVAGRLALEPAAWLYLAAGALSLLSGRVRRLEAWPVLLWTGLYFTGYTALGLVGFYWYFPPLVPALCLLAGLGLISAAQALARRLPGAAWRSAALLGLSLAGLFPQARLFAAGAAINPTRVETYNKVSAWINANTPADSSLATLEIGVIGYATGRRVIDPMGLVSPGMVGHLHDWDQVELFAVARYWPDYVVALQGSAWAGRSDKFCFASIYSQVASIESPGDPVAPVLIFRRRTDFPPVYAAPRPANLSFGGYAVLEAFQTLAGPLRPGAEWPARFQWRSLANLTNDLQFDFSLVEVSTGARVYLERGRRPLCEGGTTTQWRLGERLTDDRLFSLPPDLAPGQYRLLVEARDDAGPIAPDRPAASDLLTTAARPTAPALAASAPARLADGIQLLDDQLDRAAAPPAVTLVWRTDQVQPRALTAFVHVLGPDGALLGQNDSVPAQGALPTLLWWPGIPVFDRHPLPVSAADLAGATLCYGLYDSQTQQRQPVEVGGQYTARDNLICRPLP